MSRKASKYRVAWNQCFELSDVMINKEDVPLYDSASEILEELVDKEEIYLSETMECDNCMETNYRWNPNGTQTEYCSSCGDNINWSNIDT